MMFRLASVLLVLLLTYQLVPQAELEVAHSITTRRETPSRSQRTLFNITWGCFSTTIICAWAAIHPNIPPREGPFKKILRRLELMFWTILAPEMLPCWALNQLLAAITVRDVYNNRKGYKKEKRRIWKTVKGWFSLDEIREIASPGWTRTHGHFLIMGGFHIVEQAESTNPNMGTHCQLPFDLEQGSSETKSEGRVTILTLELLEKLIAKDPEFKIQITEAEINDRSKGDALSRSILVMQSTWFILQCLGRRVQGLNLTQLELTTLALASLHGITYVLWWDKPLGAQSVVRVYLKDQLTDSERRGQDDSWRSVMVVLQKFFESYAIWIRDAFIYKSAAGLIRLPFAIFLLLLSPIIGFAFAFFVTLNDLLETSTSFSPHDTHVPMLDVPKHRYPRRYHMLLLIALAAIFGGIHCSGWDFPFPSYAQQVLWRVASLAVTIVPIASFPFALIINFIVTRRPPSSELTPEDTPGVLTFFFLTLAYVVARLVLLGLALALLRHLPPSAFVAIDWTMFYPHIL